MEVEEEGREAGIPPSQTEKVLPQLREENTPPSTLDKGMERMEVEEALEDGNTA